MVLNTRVGLDGLCDDNNNYLFFFVKLVVSRIMEPRSNGEHFIVFYNTRCNFTANKFCRKKNQRNNTMYFLF